MNPSNLIKTATIATAILLITGCTTVPKRFHQNKGISANGGYLIEQADATGFYLETFYKSYSFMPSPDDNIQVAKDYFAKIAHTIAANKQKRIKPILKSQLKSSATRNILDGVYSIYTSGRVNYTNTNVTAP